jgi:hypothetical protein
MLIVLPGTILQWREKMTMRYVNGIWVAALLVAGSSSLCMGAGCPQGTVWREATPDDHICVSSATRTQTWNDNKTNPKENCPRGLVWREATPEDHVCVDSATRARAWDDNIHAPRDTVSPFPQR